MFMINDATYQLSKTAIDATTLRQQVISHNLANVNTQNYKSKQVEFEGKLGKALGLTGVGLKATSEKHIGGTNLEVNIQPKIVQSSSRTKMNSDGNNVDVDLESMNMAANQIKYNTLIQQTNNKLSNYHYVVRDGR